MNSSNRHGIHSFSVASAIVFSLFGLGACEIQNVQTASFEDASSVEVSSDLLLSQTGCYQHSYIHPGGEGDSFPAFQLEHDNIDASRIDAFLDSVSVPHHYDADLNEVTVLVLPREGQRIDITYCVKGADQIPGTIPGTPPGTTPGKNPDITPVTPPVTPNPPVDLPTPGTAPVSKKEKVRTLLKFSINEASVTLKCTNGRKIDDHGFHGTHEKCRFEMKKGNNESKITCVAGSGTCLDQKPTVYRGRNSSGTCDAEVWIKCE
jgi:hypothetical protein